MRKFGLAFLVIIGFLSGCSAYKELAPVPEIKSEIDGYREIKDKNEYFELEKGKKYFISFAKPVQGQVYLMIENNIKPNAEYYFTNKFQKENNYKKIPDLTPDDKNLSVFPLDTLHNKFYWIIEKINENTLLKAKYRYIEAWRFGFERDYEKEFSFFEKIRISREDYRKVDISEKLADLQTKLNELQTKYDSLTFLRRRVIAMEKYFPQKFANAKDYDYKKYLLFANDVEEEFLFQKKSLSLLSTLTELKKTENQPQLFLQSVPVFYEFLTSKIGIDNSLKNKVKELIAQRLKSVENYYEKEILKKITVEPFNLYPPFAEVEKLYKETYGFVPQSFLKYKTFFENFDARANELKKYFEYEKELKNYLAKAPKWVPNRFFEKALKILNEMGKNLPEIHPSSFREFKQYTCVTILTEKVKLIKRTLRKYEREFKEANFVVAQINDYKKENSYGEIISLLKNNSALNFLRKHYAFLDREFIYNENKKIGELLNEKNWSAAEKAIEKLFYFSNFLNAANAENYRDSVVFNRNERLFKLVSLYTKSRADSIIEANINSYTNIDSLYNSDAFIPDYVFTFDPRGEEFAKEKNKKLENYLLHLKHSVFPEKSILTLYAEILKNKNDNGVPKARAILVHAKYYKGSNKKVKNIIDEFNPRIAKTIREPKTYRKIYVLPATDNPNGENTYKFRVQLKIPTEARFPVFEINIKLPEEIARNSDARKWYDKITLNKTELKNEGRIKIIAPTSSNNYECKITPVQMDAEGRNILEVSFTFPSYKIYEISVMAQKPLIRKN